MESLMAAYGRKHLAGAAADLCATLALSRQQAFAESPRKVKLYCNTAAGYFVPYKGGASLKGKSISYSFSIQADYPGGWFSRGYFDMPSCHLERYGICTTQDGTSVGWEGNLSVSALGLSGGYCIPFGRLSAFLCAGGGMAFYATPSAVKGEGIATISMDSRAALQYNASAGLDYRISEKISMYVETQWSSTFGKEDSMDVRLRGCAFLFGIKTPLW